MRQNILFVCVQNSVRSQMAEGMGRHFLGHQSNVSSAGSKPADRVHPMAVAVMAEIGIDISNQKPKSFDAVELDEYDLVVTLCKEEQCPVLPPQTKIARWEMSDPSQADVPPEEQIRKFRKVRDDIRKKVLGLRAAEQVW